MYLLTFYFKDSNIRLFCNTLVPFTFWLLRTIMYNNLQYIYYIYSILKCTLIGEVLENHYLNERICV